MTAASPVFVALDTTDAATARATALTLDGLVGGLKLGLEFFTATGPAGVAAVAELGLPVFLDLKLHDIPNTVAGAMRGLAPLAPALTTIHASGGMEMMKAAVAAARTHAPGTKVLAVTILTSLDEAAMRAVGYQGAVADQVARLADLAQLAGVDGLVCSPHEVAGLRGMIDPHLKLVVPGIRPAWAEAGDQKRIMTPRQAIDQGADLLVIGRPITAAPDPAAAARRIAEELA